MLNACASPMLVLSPTFLFFGGNGISAGILVEIVVISWEDGIRQISLFVMIFFDN